MWCAEMLKIQDKTPLEDNVAANLRQVRLD